MIEELDSLHPASIRDITPSQFDFIYYPPSRNLRVPQSDPPIYELYGIRD